MIGTHHSAVEIGAVVAAQPCKRAVREVILHHTWRPSAAQYRGWTTVEAIRSYHVKQHGWRDIGYHYLVAPDGAIWLGRPLSETGAHVAGHNAGTIGVALILDGDAQPPSALQAAAATALLQAMFKRFGLQAASNFADGRGFHRDYASKSCPGKLVTKALVRGWFRARPKPSA
ncbi:MAG: N-acetylmuramoyl-L-alanine amidase [Rubrivivax sp.]|nr:N-acetylmuramoyl-L-alanine amidase [Rubrivivax sp.]